MSFKRLRTIRGSSLVIKTKEQFETVIKAEVTNGNGVPITRFEYNSERNEFVLNATSTTRLSGTYKYQISVTKGNVVETIQYGIIEIM
ncbi:hypothetical protein OS347_000762 [Vibrio vulnificus]|nr:hypothetical protein [Vibrio vulnificus]